MDQSSKNNSHNSFILSRFETFRHFSTFQQHCAKLGVICFIIADFYKDPFNFTEPSWRGIYTWYGLDGKLYEDDCGSGFSIQETETRLMENVIDKLIELNIEIF
jgi:hypothetical protein